MGRGWTRNAKLREAEMGPKAHSQIKMTEPSEHATQEAKGFVSRNKSENRKIWGGAHNFSQEPQCPDRGRISNTRQLSVVTRFQMRDRGPKWLLLGET